VNVNDVTALNATIQGLSPVYAVKKRKRAELLMDGDEEPERRLPDNPKKMKLYEGQSPCGSPYS
jgi:hypothetical protein